MKEDWTCVPGTTAVWWKEAEPRDHGQSRRSPPNLPQALRVQSLLAPSSPQSLALGVGYVHPRRQISSGPGLRVQKLTVSPSSQTAFASSVSTRVEENSSDIQPV